MTLGAAFFVALAIGGAGGSAAGWVRAMRLGGVTWASSFRWGVFGAVGAGGLFAVFAVFYVLFYFLTGPKPPEHILAFITVAVVLGFLVVAFAPDR